MAKLKKKIVREKGVQWLEKQGWKDISNKIDFILGKNKLESIPFKPQYLFEKDGYKFFINFFNKEDYFWSKKYECYVTGFDWWKNQFLRVLEDLSGIQSAVIFHNEILDEFIFKQINQLPKPIRWRVDACLAKQYSRWDEFLDCYKCWRRNPQTTRNCLHRTTKRRPMAVWRVEIFQSDTAFQTKLFTKDKSYVYESTTDKKSGQTTIGSIRRKSKKGRIKKNTRKSSKGV